MSKQVDEALLQKYLYGTCTEAELQLIRKYLDNEEYQYSLHQWMDKDWKTFEALAKKTGIILRLRRIAAAAAIIGIIVTAWIHVENAARTKRDNEWIIYSNNAGRRSVLLLPDSSRIFLGVASSVQYNKNYAVTNRDVRLEGEAYFIVDHNHDYPFSVVSGSLKTIDVGTEFNIRYIKSERDIEVTVSKGIVDVFNNISPIEQSKTRLYKNQRLVFNSISKTTVRDSIQVAETIGGWRNGLLSFKEKTLEQVAGELRRYYDVDVNFTNEENKKMLITTSLQNATIDEAIEIISITAGVEIKRQHKIVTIR